MRVVTLFAIGVVIMCAAMPASAQEFDLCGNKANVILKTPGADASPELKKFWGVWGKGEWAGSICNALVVSEVNGDKATVEYFYGSAPGVPKPGSFVSADATMKGKYLFFKSSKGSDVSYEFTGGQLNGWFGSTALDKKLQKLK